MIYQQQICWCIIKVDFHSHLFFSSAFKRQKSVQEIQFKQLAVDKFYRHLSKHSHGIKTVSFALFLLLEKTKVKT
jgi:hypothetical protein